MSCNCGRKREVITSVQASADVEARRAAEAEANAAAMVASVSNAISNSNSGWYLAESVDCPGCVPASA